MARSASRKKAEATSKLHMRSMLRSFLVSALLVLTAVGVAALTAVNWTEKYVLTTDNWVAFMSPLPQDEEVSAAFTTFITDKVFESGEVQTYVAEALPPRAAFLAPPLTDQLYNLTKNVVERIIRSDAFTTIWTAANRIAHERVMARARGETPPTLADKVNEKFTVDLSNVRPAVRERLGQVAQALPQRQQNEPIAINADLQARAERVGQYIRTLDFLQAVLPFALLATGLGALAFARDRRKSLLVLSGLVFVFGLLQLIGVKSLRPVVLDKIQELSYQPAAARLYDQLLGTFNDMVYGVLAVAVFVVVVMLLAGPSWAGSKLRQFVRMNKIQETAPYAAWRKLRLWVADQRYYLFTMAAILALFFLAFTGTISWIVITNTLFVLLAVLALVQILATPPYLIQKK